MCNCNTKCNNCNQTAPTPCGQTPCQPVQDCSCPVRLNSECVTYNGLDLSCSGILSGLDLNATIEALDQYICDAISEINNSINLINVGTGLQFYAGIDAIGRRKIRTLITTGNLLTSVQNTDDITLGINTENLSEFVQDNIDIVNVGTGAKIFKGFNGTSNEYEFRTLTSTGNSVTITQGIDTINLEVDIEPTSVFLEEGDNVTITGTGTNLDPYIINSIDTITTLEDGITTTVNGDGVIVPYSVEIENLQKTINTFPYTLTSLDDKHTIFIDNGGTNVIVNVPDGLVDNFSTVFIQEGIGSVTVQATGTAILSYPSTTLQNIIKGQYYWAMIEKKLTTDTYYLLGSLLPI